MSAASDRLETCVDGVTYAIPKRADVQALLEERRQLLARVADRDLLALDLGTAKASAQASAELASDYARQLVDRPAWPEFWAMLLLLPLTYTIAALGTSWSLIPYPR